MERAYEIIIPDYYRDRPNFSTIEFAETASKAKYNYYLRVGDAFNMAFIDFLKLIQVRVIQDKRRRNVM